VRMKKALNKFWKKIFFHVREILIFL
jgi:hypothetical protein